MDDLIQELRDLGVGCHVAGLFYGVVGFCDDILLLAPTRDSMEMMLASCEKFAKKNNLTFEEATYTLAGVGGQATKNKGGDSGKIYNVPLVDLSGEIFMVKTFSVHSIVI